MAFRICLIGCGGIVRASHGPAMVHYAREHAGVELAACCDVVADRAESVRARFKFARSYTDYLAMLEREKPAAVVLAVPPPLTAPLAATIMAAGYPLLLEKPPGLTADECSKLAEVAQKHQSVAMVAFNRRYTPLMRRMQEMLRSHEPSDLQLITYDFYRVNRKDPDFSTTAIHGIDAVRFLTGSDYKRIRFHYQELASGVVNTYMEAVMESGTVARLSFCPTTGILVERAAAHLDSHSYFLHLPMGNTEDKAGRLIHVEKDQVQMDISAADCGGNAPYEQFGFLAEHTLFYDAIQAGTQPPGNIAAHIQSVEVAEYMRRRLPEYTAGRA